MRVTGIARAERFSPNSVANDRAILQAVVDRLQGDIVCEEQLGGDSPSADVYLSMGRLSDTLDWLQRQENRGALVLNPPRGVAQCRRSHVSAVMRQHNLPQPPANGSHGWWLKRGDMAAQQRDDVVFCADASQLEQAKAQFRRRGITDMVVQAHLQGDLVKFYGVEGCGFFRTFYPGDDGLTKYGDERRNGVPHHYRYEQRGLQATAEQLSSLLQVPIYGGDAIVTAEGQYFLIDFNDWPSFGRCRDEAADAIARLVVQTAERNR